MPKRTIRPGVLYTREELKKLMSQATADELRMRGYVLRFDVNSGKYSVVHHTKAAGSGVTGSGLFTPPPPIQKRTPSQRVDSLMLKLVDDMKKHGGIPALQSGVAPRVALGNGRDRPATTAEIEEAGRRRALEEVANNQRVSEIVGAAWVEGRTEVTADMVRQVAASLLARAEVDHEEKLSHQVTRHED